MRLVLNRNRSNEARVKVLDVDGILIASNTMFLALLVRDKVVRSHNFTPLLRLSFVGAGKVPRLSHLALTAVLAKPVERLMA